MKAKTKFIELLKMYSNLLQKNIEKGKFDRLDSKPGRGAVELTYDKIISDSHVSVMYSVTELPFEMNTSLTRIVRSNLPSGVTASFHYGISKKVIDMTSKEMIKTKKAWEGSLENKRTSVGKYSLNTSEDFKEIRITNNFYSSWNLIFDKLDKDHVITDTEINIIFKFKKPVEQLFLDKTLAGIEIRCKERGIRLDRITKNVKRAYKEIAPTSVPSYKTPQQILMTLIDENISILEDIVQGNTMGEKLFLGTDVIHGSSVFRDLMNTDGGAINMMIIAQTGAGKSFYVKCIIVFLLLVGVNVVVWDKDGEYTDLTQQILMNAINIGSTDGNYYNTLFMDCDTPTGYDTAIEETLAILGVLIDDSNGLSATQDFILNNILKVLLEKKGIVKSDKTTWIKSKSLTYQDIYSELKTFNSSAIEGINQGDVENIRIALYKYLDEDSVQYGIFRNPVNIKNLVDKAVSTDPTLTTIDMQSRGKGDPTKLDMVKSLMMSFITDRVAKINKNHNELTAVIIDEAQRHVRNKYMVTSMKEETTHGRKGNMIPIIITNGVGAFFSDENTELKDIVSNINTFIIGAVDENLQGILCERLGMSKCANYLKLIYEHSDPKNKSKNLPFKRCFLVKFDGQYSVVKMSIPKHISDTPIFTTRNYEEKT